MKNLNNLDHLALICRSVFKSPNLNITADTCANDIGNWDSLNHVMLIMEVEKSFGVKFALGELKDLKNIGSLLRLIEKKQEK
jgi:acyl carrier protein